MVETPVAAAAALVAALIGAAIGFVVTGRIWAPQIVRARRPPSVSSWRTSASPPIGRGAVTQTSM